VTTIYSYTLHLLIKNVWVFYATLNQAAHPAETVVHQHSSIPSRIFGSATSELFHKTNIHNA